MRILARPFSHRPPRITALAASAVAVVALSAPTATSASAAAPAREAAPAVAPLTAEALKKAPAPFLFQYTFNHHLKIGGGNFTVNGRVYLVVKLNNGRVMFQKWVTARTHSITPGGTIYVETSVSSPCSPSTGNNGYARAFDDTTQKWSPRLPVPVCVRID
ncbi:hypothetical protein ACFY8P_10860 [Streptomyces sp. NPDC012693]|jgi:hypothetical protein|uniref:hypothetical protein n=1 Tax=unclassified Streptomyces TaxID=2593676 RepID=UPI0020309150|nr:hypothetical protein [Streptomyces sp. MSC1_001]